MKWSYVHAKLFSKGFHEQCMPGLKENSLKNIFWVVRELFTLGSEPLINALGGKEKGNLKNL